MSDTLPHITWTAPGLLIRIWNFIDLRFKAALRRRAPETGADQDITTLDPATVFRTRFEAPASNPRDLRLALGQAVGSLSPIPADEAVIYTSLAREGAVELAIMRVEVAKEVEMQAGGNRGFKLAGDASHFLFAAPLKLSAYKQLGVLLSSMAFMIAAHTLLTGLIWRAEQNLVGLQRAESTLLGELKTRTEAGSQQTAWETFLSSHPETRLPAARLEQLARLNAATPDEAWWLSIELQADQARITGLSTNAVEALDYMTRALEGSEVRFIQPVASDASGIESYVIEVNVLSGAPS